MVDVLFMGRKQVAARCLQTLLSMPSVRVVGVLTDNHLAVSPTTDVAEANGLPIYSYADAQSAISTGALRFELGLSMLYWRKIKAPMLHMPERGIINFHPAPLPAYKGTAGYNLAILEGLTQWSATAHYVDQEIDTGEIISSRSFPIDPDTATVSEIELASAEALDLLFKEVAEQAVSQSGKLQSTPNVGGRYVSRAEMESLKQVMPGDDLDRKIRAFWFPPYDGAYILIDGKKYTLVSREILEKLGSNETSSLFTHARTDQ